MEINSAEPERNFEIISGSNVNLELGDEIISSHGLLRVEMNMKQKNTKWLKN